MSKTAIRRHHTNRLINKFKKLQQKHNYSISNDQLSFGRIFSKDPIDCGNSNCQMCGSYNWLFDTIKPKNNTINFSNYIDDYLNYKDDVYLYP